MEMQRGNLKVAVLALVVAVTAGCSSGGETPDAAPKTTTSASAQPDTGFGGVPRTSAPSTTPPTTEPAVEPVKTTKTATPTKRPTQAGDYSEWVPYMKGCPYDNQDIVIQAGTQVDVTKDGVRDTIITRTCEASTSYWASTIEIFKNTGNPIGAQRIGVLLEDVAKADEPVVQEVNIKNGVIEVIGYGTSAKGSKSCPNLTLNYRYEYQGGSFKRIQRTVGTSPECLPQTPGA
ncbi:hypothetical protein KOI35_43380 [Actinoplanes bogorensis]|uniref:Lipoprotein n=1 Tax=Paractinoplanes bogorensis TaxID=1610840 RepID=A0ABS5Z494_9ACTN|nr:hypothetical protein [Actinoplanes bogorensis]MBU2670366.1 hypothetical protein [Actinoplanes bogorensis]